MIKQVISSIFSSLGAGFVVQLAQHYLATQYFNDFLKANLINLLIALLAINSATLGIVLTKIRELVDKDGQGRSFKQTKNEMLLSIREQVTLVAASILTLTLWSSKKLSTFENSELIFGTLASAVFVYSMLVLYDTAKSVLIIIDYDNQ